MTARRRRIVCWLAGLSMAVMMFGFIYLLPDFQYAVKDDSYILRPSMNLLSVYLKVGSLGLLRWLCLTAPRAVWFSWMQLVFLFLAYVVCQKSIMQRFAGAQKPLRLGALFAFSCVLMLSEIQIIFTQNSSCLGICGLYLMLYMPRILSDGRYKAKFGCMAYAQCNPQGKWSLGDRQACSSLPTFAAILFSFRLKLCCVTVCSLPQLREIRHPISYPIICTKKWTPTGITLAMERMDLPTPFSSIFLESGREIACVIATAAFAG